MWIKNIFLLFFGLCSGGIIAAGVYAFLAIIGVFVRLIGKTKTKKNIMLYENMIILGGVLGNIMELYKVRLPLGEVFGQIFFLQGASVWEYLQAVLPCLWQKPESTSHIFKADPVCGLPWLIIAIAAGNVADRCCISGGGWQQDENEKVVSTWS